MHLYRSTRLPLLTQPNVLGGVRYRASRVEILGSKWRHLYHSMSSCIASQTLIFLRVNFPTSFIKSVSNPPSTYCTMPWRFGARTRGGGGRRCVALCALPQGGLERRLRRGSDGHGCRSCGVFGRSRRRVQRRKLAPKDV